MSSICTKPCSENSRWRAVAAPPKLSLAGLKCDRKAGLVAEAQTLLEGSIADDPAEI